MTTEPVRHVRMVNRITPIVPLTALDRLLLLTVAALLFGFLLALGADNEVSALGQCVALGGLAVILPYTPWARGTAPVTLQIKIAAGLFAAVVALSALSLLPLGLTGAPAVWKIAGVGPASLAIDRGRTALELVKLLGLGCAFAVGWFIGSVDRRLEAFLTTLVYLAGVYGLWAILSFRLAPDTYMGLFPKTRFVERLSASLISPNVAGAFFGMILVLATGIVIQDCVDIDRRKHLKVITIADIATRLSSLRTFAWLVCGYALLFTASRIAALATAAGVLVLVASQLRRQKWSLKTVLTGLTVGAIGLLIIALLAAPTLVGRIAGGSADTAHRLATWKQHLGLVRAAPFLGFGLGSFDPLNRIALTPTSFAALWDQPAMHSVILQWLESGGAFGLVLMLATVGFVHHGFVAAELKGQRSRIAVWPSVMGASVVMLLHSPFDYPTEAPSVAVLWALLLGCGAASVNVVRSGDRGPGGGPSPSTHIRMSDPPVEAARVD